MNKKNRRRLTALATSILCLAFSAHSSFAASLTVKIGQVNPVGKTEQVNCAEKQKCDLSLELKTGPGPTKKLTVEILFAPGAVVMKFHTADGYLYSKENNAKDQNAVYETIWHSAAPDKPSQHLVSLFSPAVQNALTARILNVAQEAASNKPHPIIAQLEITTTGAVR